MDGTKPTRAAEFHCGYAATRQEALQKGRELFSRYAKYLRDSPIVELGCGEGALLLWLKQAGFTRLLGVDSNEELCGLAKSFDVPLVETDIWKFLRKGNLEPAVYFYLDVLEHVSFDQNAELLTLLPLGSRLILQTPYTESILGHRFFLNVPSHAAPYSPWVIKKMFHRFGYQLIDEGSVDWNHPPNWKNKLRSFVLRKVMGIDPDLILGGGNYFAVADRVQRAG